jgi:hypothetical protein
MCENQVTPEVCVMTALPETEDGSIRELTQEEGVALLERQTRRLLGMGADEFIKAWESGDFDDNPDQPELMRLVALIPFAR